ncbi:MAG: hypothetical protein JWO22_476 [Frankiales bacterium]|nr:hypothetical protein [Frankiales bacterium]
MHRPVAVGPVDVAQRVEALTVDVERGRAIAAALPGAELTTYEGAGHNYIVPMKDRVNAQLLDLFSRVEQQVSATA